ncbi:hypothetical protein J6590_098706 [Homalodisca vitripennis]|nr:hypothetical protein J6590_096263 [Homalodisca vitripennis]KAG8266411.1 hypothetical protein J6590_073222 [Homalodisca vitripennis]KAG8285074.1 hypothetical protein J6590_088304 [Homalodisca vitripennis]KAG8285395.1 hypothetical protein J6590_081318 [Homalodisca vitripennis]KAG8304247.1 hypothetical protein J6590_098706 [Homalodisca vitripennis]
MSENQAAGYLSQNGLKWIRTKSFTPYSLDRRPQLPQGKRPKFPQWRPQLLPRRPTFPPRSAPRRPTVPPHLAPRKPTFPPWSAPRRPAVPPRSALKWRRKEEQHEHKAEENASPHTVQEETSNPQERKVSQETVKDCREASSFQNVPARHNGYHH